MRFRMCKAQKELISESSRKAHAKGHAEGREEGVIIGRVIEKIKYIRKGADTLEEAAQDIGITVDEFLKIAEQNNMALK